MATLVRILFVVALAASVSPARSGAAGERPPALTGLAVSFKLDPRITRGLYMGDRWVSPRAYARVQRGNEPLVVEVRALGLAGKRRYPVSVAAAWAVEDRKIATVSRPSGHEVALTVRKPGRTTVTVAYGPFTRRLSLEAVKEGGSLRVQLRRVDESVAMAAHPRGAAVHAAGAR